MQTRHLAGILGATAVTTALLASGVSAPANASTLPKGSVFSSTSPVPRSPSGPSGAPHRVLTTFPLSLPRTAATVTPRLRFAAVTLPASVDLTGNTVPPGNQGQVGSCTTWALAHSIMGYYSQTQVHAGRPFAPMYLYSQINRGVDAGSSSYDAYQVAIGQGVAEQKVYSQGNYDWRTQPTAAQRANAAGHRLTSYTYLFSGAGQGSAGAAAIKGALAAGRPVMLAIDVYDSFMYLGNGQTATAATGKRWGGHMVAAFGYDATGVTIENSWGTGWGTGGYAKLGWNYLATAALEASTINGFAGSDGPVPPTPTPTPPAPPAPVTPTVTSLSGTRLVTGAPAGATVTVNGTDFGAKAAVVTLTPTATPAAAGTKAVVASQTDTQMTVKLPALAAGSYDLRVATKLGRSAVAVGDTVRYVAVPALSAVSSNLGKGGQIITLTGAGLTGSGVFTVAVQGRALGRGDFTDLPGLTVVSDKAAVLTWDRPVPGDNVQLRLRHTRITPDGSVGVTSYGPVLKAGVVPALVRSATLSQDASGAYRLSVTGTGFDVAKAWRFTGPRALPLASVALESDLDATAAAVAVLSPTQAVVRLPDRLVRGTYTLTFVATGTGTPVVSTVALRVL